MQHGQEAVHEVQVIESDPQLSPLRAWAAHCDAPTRLRGKLHGAGRVLVDDLRRVRRSMCRNS